MDMERDSLRNMLYCLARFGLFLATNYFGVIIGNTVILGVVGTFIPRLALYDNPATLSLISFFIPAIMLLAIFADDAKRHTAYGRYNPTLVSITVIISAAVYYIPAVVIGYIKDPRTADNLKEIFFTNYWLSDFLGNEVEIYALVGALILTVISISSYIIARKIYLKKFENGEYEYQFDK